MIDEYKTRCQALKDQTNYVEPQKLSDTLKKKSLDAGNQIVREMNQIQDSKYTNALRHDLLGINANDPNGLRQRIKQNLSNSSGSGGDDMNQALKYQENRQEQIAEDMLALTRSLKEQTEIANRIIRKDTEVFDHFKFECINWFEKRTFIAFPFTDCVQIEQLIGD